MKSFNPWAAAGALLLFGVAHPPLAAASNPITLENQQPGTGQWQLWQSNFTPANDVSKQIKGYASATSVNKGESISFHVSVNPAQNYTIDIYRIGWYQGLGGRFMQRIGPLAGTQQATCPTTASTGLIQCAWTAGSSITVPAAWTTGIYMALLTNAQNYQNYITFVVRDDSRASDLLYQQAVTTNQAYNNYPNDNATGKSLYGFNSYGAQTVVGSTRAAKVSFDRPYAGDGDGSFLAWEVYFVQWLESEGYDVSYSTNIDTHASGARLLNHKGFLSAGHDEYWSKPMRDAAEQARNSGVHLGFFGANAIFWQVRLEPSTTTAVPNRVLVCYKLQSADPVQGPTTTLQWRDPFINLPEQTLIGIMYTGQVNTSYDFPAPYIVNNSSHWVYAGSGFHDGDSVTRLVGYETDRYVSQYPSPISISGTYTLLSNSPISDINTGLPDYSNSSIYQAPSGAWVFGSGTIDWGWGLARPGFVDARIQQTTRNVLNKFVSLGTPAPNPPSGLSATAVSATQIDLSWTDNSTNETNFVLDRSVSNAFSTVTSFTLPANQTTFSDTGLTGGTAYYYRVKAVVQADSSAYSNTATATTPAGTPNAPSGLGATAASATQINLSWTDNSTNETNFVLERSATNTFAAITSFSLAANQAAYSDTGLTAGSTYYYRVKATNAAGSSAYSNTASATLGSGTPNAPSGLGATAASTTQINLVWTDNSTDETGFALERSLSNAFSSITNIPLPANQTAYSDTGLTAGTTYYYRVKATNAAGSSAYSNTASATLGSGTPNAPSGLSATAASTTQINLSWTDNSTNELNFALERSLTNAFSSVTSISLAANQTAYSDTGLTAGTAYYYRVKATNAAGSSAYSNTASATLGSGTPNAPSGLGATAASTTQINLAWADNSSNETNFVLERSLSSAFSAITSFSLAANQTAYSDTGLAAGTYFYRVKATNAAGSSAYSNTASATVGSGVPNAPSGLTATAASASQINLTWIDNATNETGYTVERSLNSAFSPFTWGTFPANKIAYNDTGLAAGTTYYYRVKATNAVGSSAYSSTVTATTTSATGALAPPTGLVASFTGTTRNPRITLAWTDNSSNESYFAIERSANGVNFAEVGTVGANTSTYVDGSLARTTLYYYRVKAVNTTGSSSYSNQASATTQ